MKYVAIIFLLIGSVRSEQTCGINEEYTTCGTACEPSCKQPQPRICTLQCVIGCQCKEGFLRNQQKQCVTKSQCPNFTSIQEQVRSTRSLTCASMKCREGYSCVQETINCFRAPCPQPPPRCIPISEITNGSRTIRSTNPCDSHSCSKGKKCILQQVQCIRAPCDPIPVCQ